MLPDGTPTSGSSAPSWGAMETMKPSDEIMVAFEEGTSLSVNVLELYAATDERVTFAGDNQYVPGDGEGCAHNERHYALASLAPGSYTLVHRRKHGTGDPLNCVGECPWTTFDGDEALTIALTIAP